MASVEDTARLLGARVEQHPERPDLVLLTSRQTGAIVGILPSDEAIASRRKHE